MSERESSRLCEEIGVLPRLARARMGEATKLAGGRFVARSTRLLRNEVTLDHHATEN